MFSCPPMKYKGSGGGRFLCLILCRLNFDDFGPRQHTKVEVNTSVRNMRTGNSSITTICCGRNTKLNDPFLLRHLVVEGRNTACLNCCVSNCIKKYLEIRVNRKPGDGGWFEILRGLKRCTCVPPPTKEVRNWVQTMPKYRSGTTSTTVIFVHDIPQFCHDSGIR